MGRKEEEAEQRAQLEATHRSTVGVLADRLERALGELGHERARRERLEKEAEAQRKGWDPEIARLTSLCELVEGAQEHQRARLVDFLADRYGSGRSFAAGGVTRTVTVRDADEARPRMQPFPRPEVA